MTVFSIGYEGLSLEAFMATLSRHGIDTVVDVREMPLSRKPGFSKKALAGVLNLSGLEYIHMATLGCPKAVRDRYREDGNWQRYTASFLLHLQTQRDAIADLSALVATSSCALLCYEADFNFCHRSMVAAAVRDHCGAKVQHIGNLTTRTAIPDQIRLAAA